MSPLVLGLLIGAAFGAILTLSGLSNPRLIVDMLRLKDLHLLKVLLVALGTGILGVALLSFLLLVTVFQLLGKDMQNKARIARMVDSENARLGQEVVRVDRAHVGREVVARTRGGGLLPSIRFLNEKSPTHQPKTGEAE
jgi:hypothetical protein